MMALGRSFEDALLALAAEEGARPRLKTYTAKGWHAQLNKLTSSPRGYAAMAAAGIDVTTRTLLKWLGDEEYPVRRGDRERIHAAYEQMAGGAFPQSWKTKVFAIVGYAAMGTDRRGRGIPGSGNVPLRIEGRLGDWSTIEREWEAGTLSPSDLRDHFINDVIAARGNVSTAADYLDFDGEEYEVI